MTPEGKTKAMIDRVLAKYGDELDSFKPVQNGMGSPALDYIICYHGQHIEIEAKKPGGVMTPRQILTAEKKERAGAKVFCIDGDIGCARLDDYLSKIKASAAGLRSMKNSMGL